MDVDRMRRILRTYVRNVYRYQRQYIYDVVLYQYQQDSDRHHHAAASPTAAVSPSSREVIRDLVMELIGDAQQASSRFLNTEHRGETNLGLYDDK